MLPDALLVERVAALGDKAALAELYGRHGMSLYAIAYTVAFDPEAADAAVAAAFREAWVSAGSFNARECNVRQWLADLTRRAVRETLRGPVRPRPVSRLVA
ncbi:MAG TPA: sigma factor [Gemmatimonadales bacterium]|jgi:RNA polymerase sigma-70 factor, ECF subfamily|nr:sigma factor [Gemmatimonadales bacterium]